MRHTRPHWTENSDYDDNNNNNNNSIYDLGLVGVDDIIEDDGLEESGGLGRGPAGVQCRLDARHDMHCRQHHVVQVENHRLYTSTQFTALLISLFLSVVRVEQQNLPAIFSSV